jgi:type 1 glutamine amidotransferase
MHRQDELYNSLRGPAKNVTVLASAMSPKEMGGSGEEEPMLMVIPFGNGRVVHDALGHGAEAVHCVAFAVTLQRATEWAATGKVTQKVPADFPDDKKSKERP